MGKYQKLKDMDSKKWLSENCPHLDKTSQKIGLYELCLVMEEYHKYKAIDSNECIFIEFLYYEISSSWWASWISIKWMQELSAKYFAWKTSRKFARYKASVLWEQYTK